MRGTVRAINKLSQIHAKTCSWSDHGQRSSLLSEDWQRTSSFDTVNAVPVTEFAKDVGTSQKYRLFRL